MSAEFLVENIYRISDLVALQGEVKSGKIVEGDVGSAWSGKRFNVVSIQTKYGSVRVAEANQKVTLIIKNLIDEDISPQDTIYFE